ncbi:MAG: manganese efflux pump MntP family protein [Oscillospiraceae bacterium]|nr:manganese efflux pump MntP family protein [Oscillospiraceae bacterium]
MNTLDLVIIAIGLSMDAFAVSICKGLSVQKSNLKENIIVGLYFGGFQGLMPLIGYILAVRFAPIITGIDFWISFVLLSIIGGKMVKESMEKAESVDCSFRFKAMFPLAIATSIDALAAGVSFAASQVNIIFAVLLIAAVTFIFSVLGVKIGNVFGCKYKSKAEMFGGIVLILMGVRFLLEGLGVINI